MARDPDGVIAGVGLLYVAPLSATAPVSATSTRDVSFREVGYTEAGATINTSVETEDLEVAEELEPIGTSTTRRSGAVSFEMAQATADNLALALNLGADIPLLGSDPIEPPDPDEEVYISLMLETNQGARWYFPKVKNGAEFSMARAKTGKTLIAVEMSLYKVVGRKLFSVWRGTGGAI
jgi:hypothetical protein